MPLTETRTLNMRGLKKFPGKSADMITKSLSSFQSKDFFHSKGQFAGYDHDYVMQFQ